MQDKKTTNPEQFTDPRTIPRRGRIVAFDLGSKWIGVAVSDESQSLATPVRTIERRSWKRTLSTLTDILAEFDAVGIIIGLPYNFDGTESEMSADARRFGRNLSFSVKIPIVLQDERVSTYEARRRLWARGVELKDTRSFVNSEAAAVILADFLDRNT